VTRRRGVLQVDLLIAGTLAIVLLAIVQSLFRCVSTGSDRTVAAEEASRAAVLAFERLALDLERAIVTNMQTDIWVAEDGRAMAFAAASEKISAWDVKRVRVAYSALPRPRCPGRLDLVREENGVQKYLPVGQLSDVLFHVNRPAGNGRASVQVSFVTRIPGEEPRLDSIEFPLTVVKPPAPYIWIGKVN
jgi:hypothetical protein